MRNKREYIKPTLQVVELRKSSSLLQSSATLGGYQYQPNKVVKVGRNKVMKVKTIKSLCGMLAMLAFTACSSNIDESADAPRFYNVTLTASMGDAKPVR